jgi:hypothetical protein
MIVRTYGMYVPRNGWGCINMSAVRNSGVNLKDRCSKDLKARGSRLGKEIPGVLFFFPRGVPFLFSRPGGRTYIPTILGCRIIIPRPPCLKEEDAPETKIYEMEV